MFLLWMGTLPLAAQTWVPVGPKSDGYPGNQFEAGRLDCFTPDLGFNGTTNQTIYAGSSSAGLWVTTDIASSWTAVVIPNIVPYHGVGAIEPSPNGTSLLVATMNCGAIANNYGNVFQWTPAVNGWIGTNFLSTVGQTNVHHFSFCPTNANLVFAATDNGLYRSTDGGMNWSLAYTGAFENVDFIPVNFLPGGYYVYACGNNSIISSSDLGLTFAMKASVMSLMPAGAYIDLATTYDASSTTTRYIYFDGIDVVNGVFQIVRLSIDQNTSGLESVVNAGTFPEFAGSSDRMTTTAYDQVMYFGNGGLTKYNATTGLFYDISGNDSPTTWAPYWNPSHPDSHDALILPANNLLLYCNDGGFYINSYTPGIGGIYNNSWATMNYRLNISQIWGLAVTDDNPNKYITGEQDTKAFLTDVGSTTFFSGGTEPSQVWIDNFNSNNYFYSAAASSDYLYGWYNGNYMNNYFVEVSAGGSLCNSISCPPSWFPSSEFGTNTLFQDPNRPDKIFFGTGNTTLFEYCTTNNHFVAIKGFPSAGWSLQYVSGMAFSRANKNKVYATLSNRNVPSDLREPKVFVYNDVDFDNSFPGYQDSWADITPNYAASPFTVPVTLPTDLAQIQTVGICASDWNPDKIFLGIRYVPNNPGLKVLKREAGVWTDYSTGIPASEIPVSMVYEQGTNDKVYLGTNVNIYYRDATMTSWVLYSGGLPNICINQLRINYTDNTLRAGTYGRGMWKAPLACPPTGVIGVNGGTWTTDNFFEANITISLQNVNITNGNDILHAGEYIDLQPDFLVTANSTTSFYAFIHGCITDGTTFREGDVEEDEMTPQENEERKQKDEMLFVYPNPTEGIFLVNTSMWENANLPGTISVYDYHGKLVLEKAIFTRERNEIDISEQADGIYFVRLSTFAGVKTAKILKQ